MWNYIGKTIYLGIDVHKLSYSLTAICEGEIVKRDKICADPELLIKYCYKYFPNAKIKSAYEAGFSGFSLHRRLLAHEIENIVIHPASLEIQQNDRVKTDKKDSLKIALQLSQNRLKCISIPSEEQEALRMVSRYRETLIRKRTSCVNRIKGLMNYLGISLDFIRMSRKAVLKLHSMTVHPEIKVKLDLMLKEWERISEDIETCEERLSEQSEKDPNDAIYRSIPGIGKTIARVLSNELGDMRQFKNEKQLFSYCGLTPCEYSSGEKVYRGHITRQGKPCLRMYLNQAAWRAIRKDEALRKAFERIATKVGSKRAIQAIARKLIGRARSCLFKKEFYELGRI